MPWTSDRRLWLAKDGKTVVEDGDERAATLLVGVGGELPDADAERYGLTGNAKAKSAPPANKSKMPLEDK